VRLLRIDSYDGGDVDTGAGADQRDCLLVGRWPHNSENGERRDGGELAERGQELIGQQRGQGFVREGVADGCFGERGQAGIEFRQ